MDLIQHFIRLIAGMCFFMYGMMVASDNLQILAADRVRMLMSKLAKHQIIGILSGVALTVLLQSSSAVTVMLVNLASAGVVTLTQVMGVIIGSTIGTTITVQLISFNVTQFAVYFVIVGFLVLFLSKSVKLREIGLIIFGFGLIFYGLLVMGEAMSIVKELKGVKDAGQFLRDNPVIAFAGTAFLTALLHSSAIIIGLAMTLASNGIITLTDSLYWVYGANLGTTATALLASLGRGYVGRQVAWAHLFYKAATVVGFWYFTSAFSDLAAKTGLDVSRQIANAHTILNIIAAIVFFPFINWGAALIERVFPQPEGEKEFGAKYLDLKAFDVPAVAFSNAVRELIRMAEMTLEMVRKSIKAFEKDDPDFTAEMKKMDAKIDYLNTEIKAYLVRLTDEPLNEPQSSRVVDLIALVSDIEHIGDIVDKLVLDLASKKSRLKVTFSDEGWREVREFHALVVDNFELALSAFSLFNKDLAEKVIENKHRLRLMEQTLKGTHIHRLHQKVQSSINTSNIHLELLSAYRRVNSYACNLVYSVLDSNGKGLFPS